MVQNLNLMEPRKDAIILGKCCRLSMILSSVSLVCCATLFLISTQEPSAYLYSYRVLLESLALGGNQSDPVIIGNTRSIHSDISQPDGHQGFPANKGNMELIRKNWPIFTGEHTYKSEQNVQSVNGTSFPWSKVLTELVETIGAMPLILLDIPIFRCMLNQSSNEACSTISRNSIASEVTFAMSNFSDKTMLYNWCHVVSNCSSTNYSTTVTLVQSRVHIIDLEERSNYWYFQNDGTSPAKPFAYLPFPVSVLSLDDAIVYLPSNLSDFLNWSEKSAFRDCNRTSAELLQNAYSKTPKPLISQLQFDQMVYFRNLLYGLDIHPFLFGGTALGWYRQCDLIPDTTDLDMAVTADQYSKVLERTLVHDPVLHLFWILGLPSDSLELSVMAKSVKIDLFFLYGESKESWVGGMVVGQRKKLKWTYPILQGLCSCDLRDHLFLIPCNPVGFLESDYGPQWYIPFHDRKFVWHKSHKNVHSNGVWPISQWASVYRTKFW